MDRKRFLNIIRSFIGPMIVGAIIAIVNIKLVENGVVEDITAVRVLYTFSDNFIGFLKWFAPFMSLVLIASGIREIKGEVLKFLGKFTVILISSLLIVGIITLILSHLIVPLYVTDFSLNESEWPETYFTINFFNYLGMFSAIVWGVVVGLLAPKITFINRILIKAEAVVEFVVKRIIIPCAPLWIMGSFAASTYASHGLSIVWFDLWLSFIIIILQWIWLGIMYWILAKYSGISFKLIVKAATRIYLIVVSMYGMTNSAIYPFLLDEQRDLGLNLDKAKFVTVSSFNMPGSLIAHIVFVYGLSLLFGLPIGTIDLFKYMIVLTFVLVVSPAISGGVFAITSSLLSPMLGFTDPMIALMSSMYFKQGTPNAAVNNCADFYLTGLSMKKDEFKK